MIREHDKELALYGELVDRLFANAVSIGMMGCIFTCFGGLVAGRMQDVVLGALVMAGALAAALHLGIVLAYRRCPKPRSRREWRRWELRYGWAGIASSAFVGISAARVFLGDDLGSGMVMIGLVFGSASGIMARSATRPALITPRILILVAAPIIALESRLALLPAVQGLMLALFTVAGLETLWTNYRQAVTGVGLWLDQREIARRDPLTGLGNRLAFDEFLAARLAGCGADGSRFAVHCLDLDRFKAVNDSHGHPVGDVLLQAVAGRLAALMGAEDLVARLGGDEFVVVQTRLRDDGEAISMASEITRILGEPYRLDAAEIVSGASVGTAIAAGQAKEALLREADEALYAKKSLTRAVHTPRRGSLVTPRERERLGLAS